MRYRRYSAVAGGDGGIGTEIAGGDPLPPEDVAIDADLLGGELVGFISGTDLLWQQSGVTPRTYITFLDSVIYLENPSRYEQELHKALGQTVGEVMTPAPIITISPEKSLSEAARLLNEKRVHRLPVVDSSGQVVGILSCGDILRMMATTNS